MPVLNCRCGNVYAGEAGEECPVCGRLGKENKPRFHRCDNCRNVGCPPERVTRTAEEGLCMHYKCPDPVRY